MGKKKRRRVRIESTPGRWALSGVRKEILFTRRLSADVSVAFIVHMTDLRYTEKVVGVSSL